MGTARFWHTATRLWNGKVLVAGGAVNDVVLAAAELYDPDTGAFTPTGSMGTARSDHTATLLPSGKALGAARANLGKSLSSSELYKPGA
jgi:hypothetical protein